jgi:uncharacterized MAPEG superfamily protein
METISVAYSCVLLAALFPYLLVGYGKFSGKGYNNSSPRDYLLTLDGKAKRAHYAHLNSFEAFPSFAAAVIIAHLSQVAISTINALAVIFIIFRVFYAICYINNQPTLRSLVWFISFFCTMALFTLSLIK